jgi:hypothetical protein
MGWWSNPAGAILGDGPADIVEAGLLRLAGSGAAPRLGELLAAFGAGLRSGDGLATSLSAGLEVVADLGEQTVRETSAVDVKLQRTAREMLADIADQYQTSELSRPPTVEEVVGTLDFVMATGAGRFTSDTDGKVRVRLQR